MRDRKVQCEVIVVSSETRQGADATMRALQLGAVDFITKPDRTDATQSVQLLTHDLRRQFAAIRLRRAHLRKVGSQVLSHAGLQAAQPARLPLSPSPAQPRRRPEIVALGCSTGGPAALPVLLGALPTGLGVPIAVVQHMPPLFTATLAESLDRKCKVTVSEAQHGQLAEPDHVYFAPGGRHLTVQRDGNHGLRLVVNDEPPENHCRPSVDVLFRSIAKECRDRAIAVIMTGMGNDGVAGMRALRGHGAHTLAQDEATSAVFGMPQEAIRAGLVDRVLPLDALAGALVEELTEHGL